MDKTIIYVHGASSTPLTFNYLKQNFPSHNIIEFSYDSNEDVEDHVMELAKILNSLNGGAYIIAHSLGGVIAMGATYLSSKPVRMVTISSPFAGSKAATYLKWLYPNYGVFNNVSVTNPLIQEIQKKGTVWPTLNIVTTGGDSPFLKETNDGVVSVSSQLSLKGASRERTYRLNHFEVLLSPLIVKEIKEYIWEIYDENKTSD
jgi:hypothetical protein